MDGAVDDPSDFSQQPLQELDDRLRCPICKEIFRTAVILTTCLHTFCSLCIRTAINQEPVCPSCRTPAEENRLYNNRALDAIVEVWKANARDLLLKLEKVKPVTSSKETTPYAVSTKALPIKSRTRSKTPSATLPSLTTSPPIAQRTRRKHGTLSQEQEDQDSGDFVDIMAKSQASQVTPTVLKSAVSTIPQQPQTPTTGIGMAGNGRGSAGGFRYLQPMGEALVGCPICERNVTARDLNAHLDRGCAPGLPIAQSMRPANATTNIEMATAVQNEAIVGSVTAAAAALLSSSSSSAARNPVTAESSRSEVNMGKKPVKIVYNMYKDAGLRKLLRDLDLPDYGDRNLLQERHRMYINIYNANRDSLHPKDVRGMLRELDIWERDYVASRETQRANGTGGGKAVAGESEIEEHNILLYIYLKEDVHCSGLSELRKYSDQFTNLIAQAKPNPKPKHSSSPDNARSKRPKLEACANPAIKTQPTMTASSAHTRISSPAIPQLMMLVPPSPPREEEPRTSAAAGTSTPSSISRYLNDLVSPSSEAGRNTEVTTTSKRNEQVDTTDLNRMNGTRAT